MPFSNHSEERISGILQAVGFGQGNLSVADIAAGHKRVRDRYAAVYGLNIPTWLKAGDNRGYNDNSIEFGCRFAKSLGQISFYLVGCDDNKNLIPGHITAFFK